MSNGLSSLREAAKVLDALSKYNKFKCKLVVAEVFFCVTDPNNKEPLAQIEIARRLGIKQPTVNRALKELTRWDSPLLERVRSETGDLRRVVYRPTKLGRAALRDIGVAR
jgi:DNA-binding MarR family transcriptional regulator